MADTATTTASEARTPHRQTSHRSPAVVAFAAGCLLLAFGAPRLVAAVLTLDARTVIWDVYAGDGTATGTGAEVGESRLIGAADDIAKAGRWVTDGELEGDRSLLLLRAAQSAVNDGERDARLAESLAVAQAALAAAPGQPGVWLRVSHLQEQRANPAAAAAALRMSLLSGSFVPEIMAFRIELGMRLLPVADRDTADLMRRQIRLMWLVDPDFVAKLAARPGYGNFVQQALESLSDAEMAQFQRRYGDRR